MASGILNPMHIAQKFEHLLDTYRRPDGHRWTGQQLAEATGGVVPRSYVTNLRKGRIESPGYEKLAAMAKAMGFPPEVWFEEHLGEGRSIGPGEEARGVAARLEHVFEVVRNPKTGEPYTNAGMSAALAQNRIDTTPTTRFIREGPSSKTHLPLYSSLAPIQRLSSHATCVSCSCEGR